MRTSCRALFLSLALAALLAGGSAQATTAPHKGTHRPSMRTPRPPGVSRVSPRTAVRSPETSLAQIQEQLRTRRRALARIRRQEHLVLGQLSWAEGRFRQAQARLRKSATMLAGARHAVARASDAVRAITERLSTHEAAMGARLRALYERGRLGYLDVVIGAADFQDTLSRSYLTGRVVGSDLRLFRQVADEQRQRDEFRAALSEREQQLADEHARWTASRAQSARLATDRRRILERVRGERLAQEAAIRELETESARISAIIRANAPGRLGGPEWTLGNGALLWPVPGRITSGYGQRVHPIFHTPEFHTGIDIGATWGSPVRAAADGTVLFTGWMRGYGMLVILDHGGGISTTYSHLSSYGVTVGSRVHRGDVIGRIGSTGWSTGPHLFFEVRRDGQPVDPLRP